MSENKRIVHKAATRYPGETISFQSALSLTKHWCSSLSLSAIVGRVRTAVGSLWTRRGHDQLLSAVRSLSSADVARRRCVQHISISIGGLGESGRKYRARTAPLSPRTSSTHNAPSQGRRRRVEKSRLLLHVVWRASTKDTDRRARIRAKNIIARKTANCPSSSSSSPPLT